MLPRHLSFALMICCASIAAADFSFSDPVFLSPGHLAILTQATDMDGDGDVDVVVADAGAVATAPTEPPPPPVGFVSIFRNLGNGTLSKPETFPAPLKHFHMAVEDVSGDTFPDIILPNYESGTVSILLNNGDGSLALQVSYPALMDLPRAVAVGDYDGDGDRDILVGHALHDIHAVLLNDGKGVFDSAHLIPPAGQGLMSTVDIGTGDLDGDGDLDAVFGGVVIFAGLSVSLNNGDATFTAPAVLAPEFTTAVTAADLDKDGDVDLAAMHRVLGESFVRIYLNMGTGMSFLTESHFLVASGVGDGNDIAAADVDGDGDVDLVAVRSNEGDTLSVLANRGDGTFDEPIGFPGGTNPWSVATGDLDGDGLPDMVTALQFVTPLGVAVVHNLSADAQAGDLDGDGDVDGLDLAQLLAAWGRCPKSSTCAADLNDSGVVDGFDLAILLGQWS